MYQTITYRWNDDPDIRVLPVYRALGAWMTASMFRDRVAKVLAVPDPDAIDVFRQVGHVYVPMDDLEAVYYDGADGKPRAGPPFVRTGDYLPPASFDPGADAEICRRLGDGGGGSHDPVAIVLGQAMLQWACSRGDAPTAAAVLATGAVDPGADMDKAIRAAAKHGHADIVGLLLDSPGVDPGAYNSQALVAASARGHVPVVALLLKDPRVDPCAMRNAAVRAGAARGHLDVVRLLLGVGAVNPADCDNEALVAAAAGGHHAVVVLLLHSMDPFGQCRVDPGVLGEEAVSGLDALRPGAWSGPRR